MNTLRPGLFLRAFTLALGLATSALAGNQVFHAWDFSQGRDNGTMVEIPEKSGGPAIRFRAGGSLAVDPDEAGRVVLVLDGKQTDAGRTVRNLDPLPAVQVRIRFKPASSGAPQQTILAFGSCYELRYNRERSKLEFITLYPEKKNTSEKAYVIVRADVTSDVWNQAVATFKDGRLTLAVGMSRSEESAPPVTPIVTSLRVGSMGDRPFTGSISEIVLAAP